MKIAGCAGGSTFFSGCATTLGRKTDRAGVPPAAVRFLGGDAHGIWENGRLVASLHPEKRMPSLSITKTFAALAVTRAIGEGWLQPDQALDSVVAEWKNDPQKRAITTRMLLNLTAGFDPGVAALYRGRIADKGRIAVSLPLVDPPGTRFRYGPACLEALGEVLRRMLASRGDELTVFLKGLMRRIGVSSPNWRKDVAGNYYLSTGAEFSIRDLGRLGRVVGELAAGRDSCGLNAEHFLDLAAPRDPNPMVAAGIWWNRNAAGSGAMSIAPERHLDEVMPPGFWRSACFEPSADPGWLAMVGSGGKRVYVLPSRGWVIARLARSTSWDDSAFLRRLGEA